MYAFLNSNKKHTYIFVIIISTFVAAIVYNYSSIMDVNKMNIYLDYVFSKNNIENVSGIRLLEYIFKYRISEIVLLCIISLTNVKVILRNIYLFVICYRNSLLICMLTILKNKSGILWYLALKFPYYIVYIYIVYWFVWKIDEINKMHNKTNQYILKNYFLVIIVFIVEILLESFINPYLIVKML